MLNITSYLERIKIWLPHDSPGLTYDGELVIEELLPAAARAVETFADPPGTFLYPEEEAVVSGAVEKRRREYATTRTLARAALAALGIPPAPILSGERGAPVWPPGIVGSMTHCAGYRAAAVAVDGEIHAIGIDAEEHGPLPGGVLDAVSDDAERRELARLAESAPGVHWDKLLFSAKESVYKAWFPLTRRWLDFTEARVTARPDGTFTARLLVPGPIVADQRITALDGRWLARGGLILTAVTIPGRPGATGSPARRT